MKIGIISDIHDNLRSLNRIVEELNDGGIEQLVFCGDWDMPFAMRTIAKFKGQIRAVLGNGDPDIQKFEYQLQNLEDLKNIQLDLKPHFQDFRIDNKRVGVLHGDDEKLVNFLIESQSFDLFCVGHDHIPNIKKVGKTLIVNPGSLVGFMSDKGEVPITYAIYDSDGREAKIIELSE